MNNTAPKHLNIMSWNANGIQNKKLELVNFMFKYDIAISVIQETHLKCNDKFSIPGYSIVRNDRETPRQGGGVLIATKNKICSKPINFPHVDSGTEIVGATIELNKAQVNVYSVYRPPHKHHNLDNLKNILASPGNRIIGGDFNSKHPSWGCRSTTAMGKNLYQLVNQYNLKTAFPIDATSCPSSSRKSGDVIDLFLLSKSIAAAKPKVLYELSSDHFPVITNIAAYPSHLEPIVKPVTNWIKYAYLMTSYKSQDSDYPSQLQSLEEKIQWALNQSRTTRSITNQHNLNSEQRELIKRKNAARIQWKRHGQKRDRAKYNWLREEVRSMLQEANDKKWDETIKEFTQGDKIWALLKRIRGNSQPNTPIKDDQGQYLFKDCEKAEATASFLVKQFTNTSPASKLPFPNTQTMLPNSISINEEIVGLAAKRLNKRKAPGHDDIPPLAIKLLPAPALKALTSLFNSFLTKNWYPESWKTAVVVTIPKKDKNPQLLQNRRPISITPVLSRLFEKLLIPHLQNEALLTQAIHPAQMGFSSHVGATHQAAHLAAHLRRNLNMKRKSLVAFIDFEKAYDNIDKEILMAKMKSKGFSKQITDILHNILNERKFKVRIGSVNSSVKNAKDGLPQGAPLSPVLYNIYVGDMPQTLESITNIKVLQYADDTAIIAASRSWKNSSAAMTKALKALTKYCSNHRLRVNTAKTKILGVGNKLPHTTKIKWADSVLPVSHSASYLGINFNKKLTWNQHVKSRTNIAKRTIYRLKSTLQNKNLKRKTARNIIRSIIFAQANYGSEVYAEDPRFRPKLIYGTLRKAIRIATGLPWYVRNKDMLHSLRIPDPLEDGKKRRTNIKQNLQDMDNQYLKNVASLL